MKNKKEMFILLMATLPLLIYSLFVLESRRASVSKENISIDGRQVHNIDDAYEDLISIGSHIAGVIYYDQELSEHTFSVYVDEEKNQRYRSFHSGSSSFIDKGVQAYYYEKFGMVIFSMNRKHVSQVRYTDKIQEIAPDKPFVLAFDEDITDIELYDMNGNLVKIDQFDVPVSSNIQMTNSKVIAITSNAEKGSNLFIEYAGISYNSLKGPTSWQESEAYDDFLKTNQASELVENQLNDLKVKAGFTLKLDFDVQPISYKVYRWYEADVYDCVQVKEQEFTVSSHRPSDLYLVEASYDRGDRYYAIKVDILDYYELVPGLVYHVLEEEYLDNSYEDHSRFTRVYWAYDGIKGESYPSSVAIAIDKVETIMQARQALKESYLDDIMFLENTVVSTDVINQWLLEAYEPDLEYHSKSKEGLTYKEIKELN